MINGFLDKLRGARRIELFAALALAALLAMLLLGTGGEGGGADKTELEARLERVLSRIDGAGGVSVMVTEDQEGHAAGAVIVADALEDVRTYLSLQGAVAKLLDLELNQIEIIGRDGLFGGTV